MAIIHFADEDSCITAHSLFPLVHYEYGEAFFGSWKGMRYRVALEPLKNIHFTPPDKRGPLALRVDVWPEPYSFAKTPDEEKIREDFPFEEESMQKIADWLNEAFVTYAERWAQDD